MSKQTQSSSTQTLPSEQWRVIALVGDKFDRDIGEQLKDLSLGMAFTDAPPEDMLSSTADLETTNYYLDYKLEAVSREAAIGRSVLNMFTALRAVGIEDATIRFARIGRAASLSETSADAISEMYDITDVAVVTEHEVQDLPAYIGPEDFED